jgi:ankyrin repeat protein
MPTIILPCQKLALEEALILSSEWSLSPSPATPNLPLYRLLIGLGADPNAKGQYGRTPLYRAAFAGHIDAIKVRVVV